MIYQSGIILANTVIYIGSRGKQTMVKVVKFGGSSLASAEQFTKVGDIIRSDESRKYVVPSAPGKRNSKDTKVTDMLYACYDLAENDQDFKVMLRKSRTDMIQS